MEYGKIIAVTGLPGLFELISSKNDGAIVRSLDDKSTKFVSSRVHNFSHLESIEVFTVRDNVNLIEVFQAMEKSGGSIPDGKDASALKQYFQKVYGDLDFERVYSSDLKKMVKWFDVLKKNNVEIKLTEQPEEEVEEAEVAEEVKETPKKKAAPKAEDAEVADEKTQKAPAKKKAAPKAEKEESASAKASADKEEKAPASTTEALAKAVKKTAAKKPAAKTEEEKAPKKKK